LERIWELTQSPAQHARWDLRFTSIERTERLSERAERFRYSTRIGFGLAIDGWGQTKRSHEKSGRRLCSLRFGSEDRLSLIREGAGYWQYSPSERDPERCDFETAYDYEVRGGRLGQLFDRLVFRPLMGWATAWSFDRLRLWLEKGIDPRASTERAVVHAIARMGVSFVWLWHGVVPKLLGPHADELRLLSLSGVPEAWGHPAALLLGALEVAIGLTVLLLGRKPWPWATTCIAMIFATIGVALISPSSYTGAFGPASIHIPTAGLAAAGWITRCHRPSARHCRRTPPHRKDTTR